ncbi:MAG: hypothetical protein F4X56_09745 [Gammaproteobacteria bacterium]|nr:hypothetical protein [Gammaproteobacteria bacterium]
MNFKYVKRVHKSFSINEPSTFHRANEQEKATLRSIAEKEFSLDHLVQEDQDLLDEALRFSGVEVHHSCVIDETTRAKFRAFLVRRALDRNARYHPTLGHKDLSESQDEEQIRNGWKKQFSDVSEYPYPFSEAQVLSKVVPIDLSSIQLQSRSDTTAQYTGLPSRLLTASVADDNIVEREDLKVDFTVNLETKRVTTLTLYLPKSVRVYRGISLRELSITYKFENDAISERNVLVSMDQTMKGRIWFTFRPNLTVQSKFSYVECEEEVVRQSYLYESIDAIGALGQD